MNKYDFFLFFQAHILQGCALLFLSLCVTFLALRKNIYSVFDPAFFFSVIGACAYSVVILLWVNDLIKPYYFYSFLLTQMFFFLGWLINKPINFKEIDKYQSLYFLSPIAKYFYLISVFLYFSCQLVVYYYQGIPLLMESRLSMFTGGSGFGIFSRILFVTSSVSLSIAAFRLIYYKSSMVSFLFDLSVIIFSLLVALLSGSKSALLSFVFIISLTMIYSRKFYLDRKKEKKTYRRFLLLILISIPLAIVTMYIQNIKSGLNDVHYLFTALLMRFVNTGDIFFMAWPDQLIENLPHHSGLLALFSDFLGSFRLIDRSQLPNHIGLAIFNTLYGDDILSGPNARHNVFGLFYFGFVGSIFYSFLLGFLVGLIRNKLFLKLPPNAIGMSLYVTLAYSAAFIEQDFTSMAIMYELSVLIFFPLIYFLSYFLVIASRYKN